MGVDGWMEGQVGGQGGWVGVWVMVQMIAVAVMTKPARPHSLACRTTATGQHLEMHLELLWTLLMLVQLRKPGW